MYLPKAASIQPRTSPPTLYYFIFSSPRSWSTLYFAACLHYRPQRDDIGLGVPCSRRTLKIVRVRQVDFISFIAEKWMKAFLHVVVWPAAIPVSVWHTRLKPRMLLKNQRIGKLGIGLFRHRKRGLHGFKDDIAIWPTQTQGRKMPRENWSK